MQRKKIIVLDVVGLRHQHFADPDNLPHLNTLAGNGRLYSMLPPFPAVTLPVQATMTTGVPPEKHGVVANGFYFPEQYKVSFWEQADSLVQAERIWDRLKKKDPSLVTAALFMQNILYSGNDIVVTPKPMHAESGLIQWCYSKPADLYDQLCAELGPFELKHYWGPMASIGSSRWITGAAISVFQKHRPDLLYVYLPHLDYNMQRLGPDHPDIKKDLVLIDTEIGRFLSMLQKNGLGEEVVLLVTSEYVFHQVRRAIPINLTLRQEGLLSVRTIEGREYLDPEASAAFAMVDHQVAHLYIRKGKKEAVRRVLEKCEGIEQLLDADGKERLAVNHPRSGDLIAVAAKDAWFSYPWWSDQNREPFFAPHVDIHNKPGYDPLELFFDMQNKRIPTDPLLIKGSHGRPAKDPSEAVPLLVVGDPGVKMDSDATYPMTVIPELIEEILSPKK